MFETWVLLKQMTYLQLGLYLGTYVCMGLHPTSGTSKRLKVFCVSIDVFMLSACVYLCSIIFLVCANTAHNTLFERGSIKSCLRMRYFENSVAFVNIVW